MRASLRTLTLRTSTSLRSPNRRTTSLVSSGLCKSPRPAYHYSTMSSSPPQPPAPPPPTPAPSFSSNTDPSASLPRLIQLLHKRRDTDVKSSDDDKGIEPTKRAPHALDWTLTPDAKGLKREFEFKTFKTTWEFMNAVATKCAEEKHHPEWTNLYSKVTITWTTHRPLGLSHKDLTMAEFCDDQARIHGEIVHEAPATAA